MVGMLHCNSTHRDRISFINLELSWLIISDRHPSGKQVEEAFEQIKIVACHIGHLKDRTDPTVTNMMYAMLLFYNIHAFKYAL